mmetsp:Transcript_29533/g.48952  ORF Transcript_29533/g.48952 Transcript_29533/m.48952 type:complete len:231 (-) Transcript_29533:183-875(-)
MPFASSSGLVYGSRSIGTRMSTFEPRRWRMLRVRARKRGLAVIIESGRLFEREIALPCSGEGVQKSPTPRSGKAGIVRTASPARNDDAMRVRRSLMFCSTLRKSVVKPPYGFLGVPSSIQPAYSGCHEAASPKPSRRACVDSLSCSSCSTCSPRRLKQTLLLFASSCTSMYSISSPQRRVSSLTPPERWKMEINCMTPCVRTWRSHGSDCSNVRAVSCASFPSAHSGVVP